LSLYGEKNLKKYYLRGMAAAIFADNMFRKGSIVVEPRLVSGREARYQSAKDYCRVARFGISRREDWHGS